MIFSLLHMAYRWAQMKVLIFCFKIIWFQNNYKNYNYNMKFLKKFQMVHKKIDVKCSYSPDEPRLGLQSPKHFDLIKSLSILFDYRF